MSSSTSDHLCSFHQASWLSSNAISGLGDTGRPFVIVPASVDRVWTEDCADDLPCIASGTDPAGSAWKKFELPAPMEKAIAPGSANSSHRTRVVLSSRVSVDRKFDFNLHDHLSASITSSIEDLIDRHIDLITGLFDSPSKESLHWRGNVQSVAFRRCEDVARRWHDSAASKEPRMALVVRLARTLSEKLSTVCQNPRHALRRERQQQPIGRIREVDSACLRWLARQPGETVAEKAGIKQTVMAVVRVEDIDTPENRVVRDLLIRGVFACERYLRENRNDREHPRVVLVHRFQHLLRTLTVETPIGHARRLVGVPQPNNVLLHDVRYQALWQAYSQLVRQQMLEDSVWRWRHRLFAEDTLFCVIAALQEIAENSRFHTGDVLLRLEQTAGRFIDARTNLGLWQIRGQSGGTVDVVLGSQMDQHPLIPPCLKSLAPDFVLIGGIKGGKSTISAVWCVLDFNPHRQSLDNRFLSLAEALEGLGSNAPDRALLIQPCLGQVGEPVHEFEESDQLRGVRVTLPLQHHFKKMVDQIAWALKLN